VIRLLIVEAWGSVVVSTALAYPH